MSMKKKKNLTRRDFLKGTAGAALAGSAGLSVFCEKKANSRAEPKKPATVQKKPGGRRSSVVLIRDREALNTEGVVNAEILARMLDDGVTRLTGAKDPAEAWYGLIRSDDTVGIKSNVWRFLPTPKELEETLRLRIQGVGVPAEKIDVDDRGVLDNPVFQKATALINVRTSRTHHWSGVGSLLKNYIMFHPEPWSWHDDSCANLAGLWDMPVVKGKTRLNILVMLTPLFHGKGPHHFQADYTWPYKGLVISQDPVAADATGLRILEAQRRVHFGKNQPFATPPKHIRVAQEKFGLGVADPERIELIKMGWMDGCLI